MQIIFNRCLIQSVFCMVSVVLRWLHRGPCAGQRDGTVCCEICRGAGEETRRRQTVVHAEDVLHIARARHTPSPHHWISGRDPASVPVEFTTAEQFQFSLILKKKEKKNRILNYQFKTSNPVLAIETKMKNVSFVYFHNGWDRNSLKPIWQTACK